jgi:hypothetical protein
MPVHLLGLCGYVSRGRVRACPVMKVVKVGYVRFTPPKADIQSARLNEYTPHGRGLISTLSGPVWDPMDTGRLVTVDHGGATRGLRGQGDTLPCVTPATAQAMSASLRKRPKCCVAAS